MPEKSHTPDENLQQEFNRWAEAGEGEKMRNHHLNITEKTLRYMDLRPGERVLDLGCGSGWATRLIARLVSDGPEGFGQVVGVDISDEMIRQARAESKEFENVMYVWGSATQIPWEENFFDKMLSVESFYYYPDQDRALAELFRVMAPHGRLFILINLYRDNEYSLQWVDKLKVPVHVRSAAEYVELLKKHMFENVEYLQIPDDTPTPDDYVTKSFRSLDDLKAFKTNRGTAADGVEARFPDAGPGVHGVLKRCVRTVGHDGVSIVRTVWVRGDLPGIVIPSSIRSFRFVNDLMESRDPACAESGSGLESFFYNVVDSW